MLHCLTFIFLLNLKELLWAVMERNKPHRGMQLLKKINRRPKARWRRYLGSGRRIWPPGAAWWPSWTAPLTLHPWGFSAACLVSCLLLLRWFCNRLHLKFMSSSCVCFMQVCWWPSTSHRNEASVTWTTSTWMAPLCVAFPSSISYSRCHWIGCTWCMWWCSSVGHTHTSVFTPAPSLFLSPSGCNHFIGDGLCGAAVYGGDESTYSRPAVFHFFFYKFSTKTTNIQRF